MIYLGEDKEDGEDVYLPVLQRADKRYCYLMWRNYSLQHYGIPLSEANLDHTPIGPTNLVEWSS